MKQLVEQESQTQTHSTETIEKLIQTDMVNEDFNKHFSDFGMQADLITDQRPQIQTYILESKQFADIEVQVDLIAPIVPPQN